MRTKPDNWLMYSDLGNQEVEEIVDRAKRENLTWPQVWKELYLLHFKPGFLLAIEREVTERVYNYLGFSTPFYFYGLTVNNKTLFDIFPELKNKNNYKCC